MNVAFWGLIVLTELYRQDGRVKASKFTLGLAVFSVLLELIKILVEYVL